MNRVSVIRRSCLGAWLVALVITSPAPADELSVVQSVRAGGCGGATAAAQPLHHSELLDRAAKEWAASHSLATAVERAGYPGRSISGLYLSGPEAAKAQLLSRSYCRTVASPSLREMGLYRRGADSWLVLGSSTAAAVAADALIKPGRSAPAPQQGPMLSARALELVNEVRARGTRCGAHSFAPAPPVALSGTLASVALGHATDMAEHNYFEHEDRTGQSPADRVRAVGYHEKLVGENIAYGPETVEEVVRGWLGSPGHCENIMDPRFAEMGIGYAPGHSSRRGLYWVQVLAAPRA